MRKILTLLDEYKVDPEKGQLCFIPIIFMSDHIRQIFNPDQGSSSVTGKGGKLKKFFVFIAFLIAIVIAFGAGMYMAKNNEAVGELAKEEVIYLGKLTGKYQEPKEGQIAQNIDFSLYWEVWDAIKNKYVDKEGIEDKELFYGSLEGLVRSVGDPYTVFMDPQESLDFEKSLREDSFEGIGAEISIRDNILTIVAPLSDTPAAKAGLQPGDKVLAIDGESTANIGLDDAVQKIRGEEGTVVTLTISRKSFEQARDIDITRGYIVVKSVRVQEKEDGIYVIEITNFKNDTVELFNSAVRDIIAQDPQGIILDVRNNPGGYLDGAVEVASEWVEDGNIVLEEFGDGSKQEYKARGMARLKDIPTVVLVNIGSASASEIVAGALQDHGQAIVLGEKTFGKGSVQSLENFSDQSSIKVTVAKWLTPNGSTIQDKGIEPDIKVEMTEDDYDQVKDPQMDKAMEVLIKGPEEVKKTLEQQEDDNG